MTTSPNNAAPADQRVTKITAAIRSLAQQVMQPAQDAAELRADWDAKRDEVTSIRESLMIQVARMSAAEKWTKPEIANACKEAGKINANRPAGEKPDAGEKTMIVFISDLRQVAHPRVASRYADLMTFRDDAWGAEDAAYAAAEGEAKQLVARPCRKLWGRRYHMLMGMVRDVIDEKADFHSASDVTAYAVSRDPDLDPEKVKARIDGIVAKLVEIYADFQHDDIKVAADYLGVLDINALIASKVGAAAAQPASTPNESPVGTPAAAPAAPMTQRAARIASTQAKPAPEIAGMDDIDTLLNDTRPGGATVSTSLATSEVAA